VFIRPQGPDVDVVHFLHARHAYMARATFPSSISRGRASSKISDASRSTPTLDHKTITPIAAPSSGSNPPCVRGAHHDRANKNRHIRKRISQVVNKNGPQVQIVPPARHRKRNPALIASATTEIQIITLSFTPEGWRTRCQAS